ncbi:MAG: hypothetical protein M3N13_08140 [Candidatus Eremiobacteraeota bacterium]|nr:hypothetical protein [Candidatus Eremiobacteraeota bacterium]
MARWAKFAGANFERGRAVAARPPSEPLSEPTRDWAEAVKVLSDRRTIAYGSLQRVESRISPMLGGALAAIALSFDRNGSLLDLAVVLLYFVPLHALVAAYLPQKMDQVPDAKNFVQQWELTPGAVTRKVAYALADVLDDDKGLSSVVQQKAVRVRWAVWWLYGVTALVVVTRLVESYVYASVPLAPLAKMFVAPRAILTAAPLPQQPASKPTSRPTPLPSPTAPKPVST